MNRRRREMVMMTSTFRSTWILAIPPAVLFLLLFGPVLFAPEAFAPATHDADFYMYYFPLAELAFEILRGGNLPLWNPYLYCGMPLLASIEIGVLYPPNWIHVLVPAPRAFCLLYVFHVLIAGTGTWIYVRGRGRSVGAATFSLLACAFSAPPILHHDIGMTSIVYSASWLPAILAAVDRCVLRRTATSACVLAVLLACQFLAGFPMFTLYLAGLIPIYLLAFAVDWHHPLGGANRKTLLVCFVAAVLALGLVAPQLLSTLEYLNQSYRGTLGYAQATHCSFPAPNLLTFLVPEFFGDDRRCRYWGEGDLCDGVGFSGVTTLLLALFAALRWKDREVLFWSAVLFGTLALCLGKNSPVYDLAFLTLPGVNKFRGISRLSIFAVFSLAMLAGIGFDVVASRVDPGRVRRFCQTTGGAAALALLCAAVQMLINGQSPSYWITFFDWVRGPGAELFSNIADQNRDLMLRDGFRVMLQGVCWSAGIVLAGSVILWWDSRRSFSFAAVCLTTLLAMELYGFASRHVVLMDTRPWKQVARQMRDAIGPDDSVYRIAGFATDPPLLPNRFLYGRLQSTGGHENFILNRYSLFVYRWTGLDPAQHSYLVIPDIVRIYDLLNVKYYAIPDDTQNANELDPIVAADVFQFEGHSFSLYRNANVLPRARLVHSVHKATTLEESARLLPLVTNQNFETAAVLETNQPVPIEPISEEDRSHESVSITEYTPNRVVIEARCARGALLVLGDNYYPGWKAFVDGRATPVYPVNLFMRGVPLDAGTHRIEMNFEPASFQAGCWLAAASALLLIVIPVLPIAVRRRTG